MEQVMEIFNNGFSMTTTILLIQMIVGAAVYRWLGRKADLKAASLEITSNDNISFGDHGTWLLVGHSTGANHCKCAKKDGDKCYLQVAQTGGLLIYSTKQFQELVKHIVPAVPEGVASMPLYQIK